MLIRIARSRGFDSQPLVYLTGWGCFHQFSFRPEKKLAFATTVSRSFLKKLFEFNCFHYFSSNCAIQCFTKASSTPFFFLIFCTLHTPKMTFNPSLDFVQYATLGHSGAASVRMRRRPVRRTSMDTMSESPVRKPHHGNGLAVRENPPNRHSPVTCICLSHTL